MDIGSATSIASMAVANSKANTGAEVLAETLQKTAQVGPGASPPNPIENDIFPGKGQHINIRV